MTRCNGFWIVFHFDVRRDATIFYFKFTAQPVKRRTRCSDRSAIEQCRISADAN
jgi:hypothetical protein